MASNSLIPPYIQTNANNLSYGLGGEVPPEIALEEQALNRKQQIANLLLQRGMQSPQGQMAGRFYVAPSPMQGVAQLANVLAGGYITSRNDEKRKDLANQNRSMTADAIQAYMQKTSPQPVTQELEGPGAPVQKDLLEVDPYIQQVNAMAQPSREWDQQTIIDQGKNGLGTIERSAEQNAAEQIQRERMQRGPGFFKEGPRPTTTTMQSPTPDSQRQALIEAMTSQIPGLRQFATLQSQQDMARQEHANQRDFLAQQKVDERAFMGEQKQLDRDNRLATTEAQLNQALLLGLITKDQKDQMMAMTEQANKDRTAYQQGQLDLQKQIAGQTASHNKAMEDIHRQQLNQGKVPAGYRATAGGNLEAIPGGPADTKLQGQLNADTAAFNTLNAGLSDLVTNIKALRNHPGLPGITGLRGALPNMPGSEASNAAALLESLRSKAAVKAIQDLRASSKTGGAVGQVTEKEWPRLENLATALSTAQSLEAMQKALDDFEQGTLAAQGRLTDAFNMKHPSQSVSPAQPSKAVVRTGKDKTGRKVVEYSDGTIDYAP